MALALQYCRVLQQSVAHSALRRSPPSPELAEVCINTLLGILDGMSAAANGTSPRPAPAAGGGGAPAPGAAMRPVVLRAPPAAAAQPQEQAFAAPAAAGGAAQTKSEFSAELSDGLSDELLSDADSSDMEGAQSEPAATARVEEEVPCPRSAPPTQ